MLIERIAKEFGAPIDTVSTIISTAPYRYKVYEVQKKSGEGTRTIAQPAREIKVLQRFLVTNVINRLPVHDAAMAYRRGRSIRKNAEKHARSMFLLKMDFRDFFPSLHPSDLTMHINRHMANEFDEQDLTLIERICFWMPRKGDDLRLSIGGPSSPFISNTLMFEFDIIMEKLSEQRGVTYTRYADDLTFSTKHKDELRGIEGRVNLALTKIQYPKLLINQEKTIHTSKKYHRKVTGLVLSSQGEVSLGRSRKRNIRAMMHHAIHNDLDSAGRDHLSGLLAFSLDAEPAFVERLKKKYGPTNVERLLKSD